MANLPLTIGGAQLQIQGWYTPIAGFYDTGGSVYVPRGLKVGSDGSVYTVVAGEPKPTTATYSPTPFSNFGANATLNVKATPGNVFSATCFNANASARYLQLHNTATVPADQAVPLYPFLVPAGSQIIVGTDFFTNEGANFSTGIAFAFSTTRNTYTAGTAADQTTIVHFA